MMTKKKKPGKTSLLADMFDAQIPVRDEQYVDTHPDSRGLVKQGVTGPKAPFTSIG